MPKWMLLTMVGIAMFAGDATAGLDSHLEALEPYVGKAVRVVHSLNEGEYGGETIIFWDTKASAVAFYYFTTGGFFTHGTMTFEKGAFIRHPNT